MKNTRIVTLSEWQCKKNLQISKKIPTSDKKGPRRGPSEECRPGQRENQGFCERFAAATFFSYSALQLTHRMAKGAARRRSRGIRQWQTWQMP